MRGVYYIKTQGKVIKVRGTIHDVLTLLWMTEDGEVKIL